MVYLQVIFNDNDIFFLSIRPKYDNWLLVKLYSVIFNEFSNYLNYKYSFSKQMYGAGCFF